MVLALMISPAWPLLPVIAVTPLGNVALAPEPGAAKVTVAPGTRLPKASRTVATSGLVNAVLTVALWPEPEATRMLPAAPALLVSVKEADVATLATDAVIA